MVLDTAQLQVLSEFAADTDDLVESVSNLLQVYDRHNFLNVKILAGFKQNIKALGTMKGAYTNLSVVSQKLYKTSMVALIDTMFNFAMSINTAAGDLRVMTGMSREASDAFFANQQQLSYFNVTAEDTSKTVGELFGTFTDFTFATRQQQETLKILVFYWKKLVFQQKISLAAYKYQQKSSDNQLIKPRPPRENFLILQK